MFNYNCNNMENNKLGAGILQISTEERAVNYRWEKDADKLDKNISIVCMDDIQNLVNDGWTFKTKMPIREGMTLALHPFISKCYKEAEKKKYAKKYSREETFSGEFTRQGYEKAKQLIKQYKLEEEEDLNYIVEQRNPDDGNTLTEQSITVDLSKELNRLTEWAFSLNVLKGIFTLDANVKQTMSIQKEIIVETKLVF